MAGRFKGIACERGGIHSRCADKKQSLCVGVCRQGSRRLKCCRRRVGRGVTLPAGDGLCTAESRLGQTYAADDGDEHCW